MEQKEQEIHSRTSLWIPRILANLGSPLVVDETTIAWEIYNDRATTLDRELIKDGNDSLNTLLISVRFIPLSRQLH